MILDKFWRTFKSQANKLANAVWAADPIAHMQYEYDQAVAQLKDGRAGLEQYRGMMERLGLEADAGQARAADLDVRVRACLQAGDRDAAGRYALELRKVQQDVADKRSQLALHEQAYANHLAGIQLAGKKLAEIRARIQQYQAELKMSRAEADLARLSQDFQFDVTTDFGQIEQIVQDQIGLNRARTRVAADLSGQGAVDFRREQAVEGLLAAQALREFEARSALEAPGNPPLLQPPREGNAG